MGSPAAEEQAEGPQGLSPTEMVIRALGRGVDSILGHLLGAAVGELPAVSGRHKATSVPATQGRPPLEINATYGGSTDFKKK